ncbi:hypothetical protein Hanom_Chr10g00939261 [Helianthus anomalus]
MVNNVTTAVPDKVVCERVVNVEEFRKIGIVQMFERQGSERVLDWCEYNTSQVYLAEAYDYPAVEHFLDNHAKNHDLEGMTASILPYNDGGVAARRHLMVEGKILQGIS